MLKLGKRTYLLSMVLRVCIDSGGASVSSVENGRDNIKEGEADGGGHCFEGRWV